MLYLHGESLEEMASPLKERMGVYVCSQSGCKMKMPPPHPLRRPRCSFGILVRAVMSLNISQIMTQPFLTRLTDEINICLVCCLLPLLPENQHKKTIIL